jgi:hypothetical protein
MPNYATKFQKRADGYFELVGDAVDPQYQRLWLALARECLRLITDARDLGR